MRLATWNLEHASVGKNPRRTELLLSAAADVWVLTETRDSLALSPTHSAVHSDPRPRTRVGERWVSLWSRFPLLARVEVRDPSRTVCALFDAPSGPLLVYGTVMPWHADRGPDDAAKGWTEQHRVVPEQAAEWKALRDAHPNAALVVAGDFNMSLGGPRYYGTKLGKQLLEVGLTGAGLACVTRTEDVPVGLLGKPHIDHIAVPAAWSSRSRVVAAWPGTIDGVRLSDHSAIVVEIAE
jgi:hypothetical protein